MTDEELIEQVARVLDHPSLYMGGASHGSRRKARAILPIIKAERAEVVAEIVAWLRDEANGWMCADTASSEIEDKFGGRDETL